MGTPWFSSRAVLSNDGNEQVSALRPAPGEPHGAAKDKAFSFFFFCFFFAFFRGVEDAAEAEKRRPPGALLQREKLRVFANTHTHTLTHTHTARALLGASPERILVINRYFFVFVPAATEFICSFASRLARQTLIKITHTRTHAHTYHRRCRLPSKPHAPPHSPTEGSIVLPRRCARPPSHTRSGWVTILSIGGSCALSPEPDVRTDR